MKKLARDFYTRADTLQVAQDLLGKTLVVPSGSGERISGMIVETEAYCGIEDKAAHSYGNRRTKRTETMFALGGTAYVFFIYGMYFQFNVVTGEKDSPHAVLIRAVEPVEGIETMRTRRGRMKDTNLTSGPGKLCIALGIDKTFDNEDLTGSRAWLEAGREISADRIKCGKRIGIDYAEEYIEKPWRFRLDCNSFVSR